MANPGATITFKDNRKFSLLIAGYWIDVAAELDLEGEKVADIRRSSLMYPTEKDKALQMLEELSAKKCTYMQLAEALRRLDKAAHAEEVLPPRPSANKSGDSQDGAMHVAADTCGPKPPVFISYQWDIQDWVKVLKGKLEDNGLQCWMDIGQMGGGDALYAEIDAGIRAAKVVISCVTEKYSRSENCQREVTLADTLKKPIIPLRFDESPWPPPGQLSPIFAKLLYIKMAGQPGTVPDEKFRELLVQVRERLG